MPPPGERALNQECSHPLHHAPPRGAGAVDTWEGNRKGFRSAHTPLHHPPPGERALNSPSIVTATSSRVEEKSISETLRNLEIPALQGSGLYETHKRLLFFLHANVSGCSSTGI